MIEMVALSGMKWSRRNKNRCHKVAVVFLEKDYLFL